MKLIYILALALLAPIVSAAPELKGKPQELKSFLYPDDTIISISASADESAYSDIATVNLIVTTEKKLLSQSIQANTQLRKKIRKSLNTKGIQDKEINNSKFSSSPQYGWFGKEPSSHKVVNRMAVKIAKESHFQDIAEIADQFQQVKLSGVIFSHSKEDEYYDKVKDLAMQKLLKKKAYYEKSLSMQLKAVRFHESEINSQATEGANMVEEVVVYGIRADSETGSFKSRRRQPERQSSFDEIQYSAGITVDFKVVSH